MTRRALAIATTLTLLLVYAQTAWSGTVHRKRSQMGTFVEIKAFFIEGKETAVVEAIEAAFAEIARIETVMSEYREQSEIAAVNEAAGRAAVPVGPELLELLVRALHVSTLTGGAFDVTVAALSGLWNFTGGTKALPPEDQVVASLPRVGYRRIQVDREAGTLFLPEPGMRIGLGAVAKGYAVDRACAVLVEGGVTSAIVNAGGDLRALGRKDDAPWIIGVQDTDDSSGLAVKIEVEDRAVVTSGDYERFALIDGVRYSHIIDPRTGRPARTASRSATVIAGRAELADALATGLFILGPAEGLALCERLDGVEAFFIDSRGHHHWTSGIVKIGVRLFRSLGEDGQRERDPVFQPSTGAPVGDRHGHFRHPRID